MFKRNAFIASLLSASGLLLFVPKVMSGPTLWYTQGNIGIVSTQRCVNTAYSVFSRNGLKSDYDVFIYGDAKFALGDNRDTTVIINCTNSAKTGEVIVMASSYRRLKYEYVKAIANDLSDLLN